MPNFIVTSFLILCAAFDFSPATSAAASHQELNTYIIHLAIPHGMVGTESLDVKENRCHSLLSHVSNDKSRMVHMYHNVLNGFAAKLTPEEAQMLQDKDEVLQTIPQRTYRLLTTHTPRFLGLERNSGVWSESNYGKGVIIAVLDTGIAPDHPSFNDKGMPPPPAKWKGKCELNGTTCNNKLIGARSFVEKSPNDLVSGHGTHTASTAAGNFVDDASLFEEAKGTASGMAPYAHLAIYRVCYDDCAETDILAAMDAAIDDGVDVISLSIGFDPTPFYTDVMAVASFVAMQNGIFVSAAAGNNGTLPSSLSNESPWMLTVGASTIDREIRATALLGNNLQFEGESLFQPKDFSSTQLPLVYFPNTTYTYNQTAMFCAPGSLDNVDVKGKIVLCLRGDDTPRITKGQTVKDAGGAGMIYMNGERDGYSTLADPHVIPATHVSYDAAQKILQYVNSTSTPTATFLFKGTVLAIDNSPTVASFSSRGPTTISVGILKPDIIGPGVSIIAAWPYSVDSSNTNTQSTFNMISGTSMSCPHLSGIAALIKGAHPDWSPAAIKSAIMTSANQLSLTSKGPILDERHLPANVFAKGAGHVNPQGAIDPGLIYDIKPDDYIPYLCGLGYNDTQVGIIVQRAITCSTINAISGPQLNYPSFSIELKSNENVTYKRTVTNVGEAESYYAFGMELISGVSMIVSPDTLSFTQVNQNITYHITFARTTSSVNNGMYVEGAVMWISNKHSVRSPVSVKLI